MPQFMSTYTNKVDAKGRVSLPASFRANLPEHANQSIIIFQAINHDAIEGCDLPYMDRLLGGFDDFSPFSDEHDAFSLSLMSGTFELSFDGQGRIIIPKDLMEFAGITNLATFAGKGQTFQIWNPDAFKVELARARETAKLLRGKLRLRPAAAEGEAS